MLFKKRRKRSAASILFKKPKKQCTTRKKDDTIYMWSALMEDTCPICKELDGKHFTREEKDKLPYQPGRVHKGCNCIWAKIKKG